MLRLEFKLQAVNKIDSECTAQKGKRAKYSLPRYSELDQITSHSAKPWFELVTNCT